MVSEEVATAPRAPGQSGGRVCAGSLVAERGLEQAWPKCRIARLIGRTRRLFPSAGDHNWEVRSSGLSKALACHGGWGVMKRVTVLRLCKEQAAEQDWETFLQGPVATLTCDLNSLSVTLQLGFELVQEEGASVTRGFVVCKGLCAHCYLSLHGCPLDPRHPLRLAVGGVVHSSPLAARAMVGGGVDLDVASEVWLTLGRRWVEQRRACGLEAPSVVDYVDVMAGISTMGAAALAAARELGCEFQYVLMAELSGKVAEAHRRGWQAFPCVVRGDARGQAVGCGRLRAGGWVHIGGNCAAFSNANPSRLGARGRAGGASSMADNVAALNNVLAACPDVVVIENVAALATARCNQRAWQLLLAELRRHGEFLWWWQRACPHRTLRKPIARDRVFVGGVRRTPHGGAAA